jgi:hypothetical protein
MKQLDDKYSPNLARWLRKRKRHTGMPQSVFRDADGVQWIGWLDEDLYLIGSRLMAVLCNGAKEEVWAYPIRKSQKLREIPGFWDEYERVGRCAIDPEHAHYFLSRDGRFAEEGDSRTCKWCGAKHVRERYVEHVPRERWLSPNA